MLGKLENKIFFCTVIFIFFANFLAAESYVASSTNYRLELDTVAYGGGLSTSTNFSVQDSVSDRMLGTSTSTSNMISAGPIAMTVSSISVTYPSSVSLSPRISSLQGGQGNGEASIVVTTDNLGGYTLSIRASTNPALRSATDGFSNYASLVVGTPDFEWSTVGPNESKFGFSPKGSHVVTKYRDNGSTCNSGSLNSVDKCWDSVETTNKVIAQSTSNNQPSGTGTTIKFRAEAGTNRRLSAGIYSSEITLTALPL